MRATDHCSFGDLGMRHQRTLHFHRAKAMTTHIDHVVHAAQQPVVAVLVLPRPVTGEIGTGNLRPVGLLETRSVTVDAARHGRPGPPAYQQSALSCGDWLPI